VRESFTRRSVNIIDIIPDKEVNLTSKLCDSFEESFDKLWVDITRQHTNDRPRIDKFKILFKNTFFNLLLREDALHGYGHVNVTIETLKDIIKWYLMDDVELGDAVAGSNLHPTYIAVMEKQVLPLLNQPFMRTHSGDQRTLFSKASDIYARKSRSPPPPAASAAASATTSAAQSATSARPHEVITFQKLQERFSSAPTGSTIVMAASASRSPPPHHTRNHGGADISTYKSKKRNFKNSHNNRTRKYRERKQKTTRTNRTQHPSQNKSKTIRNKM